MTEVERVGDTIRRPAHARSAYVHAALEHLASVGFTGAPRMLGRDEAGRDVFTFLPGSVIVSAPALLSDAQLDSAARLVRAFHDATAGTPFAGDQEVVCHSDLGAHNIVFEGDVAVGIIDWDEDLAPGPRLVDFAHLVWCCADVTDETVPVGEQARRVRLLCDAYGWEDVAAVVEEIAARFRRARDAHRVAGRVGAEAIFASMLDFMELHRATLVDGR